MKSETPAHQTACSFSSIVFYLDSVISNYKFELKYRGFQQQLGRELLDV